MTSTYDHRIIQGAESGRFLQTDRGSYLQGENGFYEGVFAVARRDARPAAPPPPPAAGGRRRAAAARRPRPPRRAATRSCCRPCRPRPRCSRRTARTATSPRASTRSAPSPSGDPALDPEPLQPDARADGADPGAASCGCTSRARRSPTRCRTCARPTAARSPTRSSTSPATASACGCASRSSPARSASQLTNDEQQAAAQAPDRGRRARALHAQGLPRPEAVLDRGPRHDGADDRRADPARRRAHGGARGRHRHGPPRPAQRARAQPRPPLRHDLRRVRGRLDARGGHRRSRRAAPATSSTTTARRAPTSCPTASRSCVNLESNPTPPRVRRPGRRAAPRAPRRRRARARTRTQDTERRRPDRPARRRRLPRPGRRRRDAQPAGARRLQGRRHAAPDPEQPGRLHDRPRRRALDALGLGPREGLRRADHPRQRRRRRGLHQRRAARVRLPPGVRPRRR